MAGACKDNQTISKQDCMYSRGAEIYQGRPNDGFQADLSSTWHEIGIYRTETRSELGYNASGLYGLDTLGLMVANSGGPTLENQTIGAVVNPRLWLGRLGMDDKPNNFSDFDNPQRSLIKTLKEEGLIPSLSYGYTAGAYYKQPSMFGSLTWGGYDQSRFVPNNITFPFDANDSRKPSLSLQWITTQNITGQSVSILQERAPYMLVDFAESQIWLPVSACDQFATAFNLTYDNTTDLYLVDASTHAKLVQQNPNITFRFGQSASDPTTQVDVVLPYSAFDQQASFPIYENATNYFPIRRAYNETQYTLGRTFFQEAYIKMDYERQHFSIHQALFPAANEKQQLIPISSIEAAVAPVEKRLSKGAIAGISIGSFLLLVIMSLLGFWFCRRRRRRRRSKNQSEPEIEAPKVECGGQEKVECDGQQKVETEGVAIFEKDGLPYAEMEGHIFPELYGGEPEGERDVPDIHIQKADMDTVFELYESTDNNRRFSYEETTSTVFEQEGCPSKGQQ
ncbi:hypothetical protein yc1106_01349 [Curvularia clavata]|uniref:Peptidase A1 domain-containing protein n=1 Tax=Curvularia clavata TaxID=95742 RepID=A0A9Q8Z2Q2_CURCL|nr:hypothetical protein yc1106_01349 [Curvularia clavata]